MSRCRFWAAPLPCLCPTDDVVRQLREMVLLINPYCIPLPSNVLCNKFCFPVTDDVVRQLREMVLLPMQYPALFEGMGLRPPRYARPGGWVCRLVQ